MVVSFPSRRRRLRCATAVSVVGRSACRILFRGARFRRGTVARVAKRGPRAKEAPRFRRAPAHQDAGKGPLSSRAGPPRRREEPAPVARRRPQGRGRGRLPRRARGGAVAGSPGHVASRPFQPAGPPASRRERPCSAFPGARGARLQSMSPCARSPNPITPAARDYGGVGPYVLGDGGAAGDGAGAGEGAGASPAGLDPPRVPRIIAAGSVAFSSR